MYGGLPDLKLNAGTIIQVIIFTIVLKFQIILSKLKLPTLGLFLIYAYKGNKNAPHNIIPIKKDNISGIAFFKISKIDIWYFNLHDWIKYRIKKKQVENSSS